MSISEDVALAVPGPNMVNQNEETSIRVDADKNPAANCVNNEMLRIDICLDNNQVTTLQWSSLDSKVRVEEMQNPGLANAVINYLGSDGIISADSQQTLRSEEEDLDYLGSVRSDVILCADSQQTLGSEEEVMEIELGRAVLKYYTHAPYCPNCRSLIIKLVLRRNKNPHARSIGIFNSYEEQESTGEEIEVDFERAVEKVHTHTPFCPNCNLQITKVILRRKNKDIPRKDRPFELFGCLNCFSFFIPSGNGFKLFKINGSTVNDGDTSGEASNAVQKLTNSGSHSEIIPPLSTLPNDYVAIGIPDQCTQVVADVAEVSEIQIKKQHNPNFQLLLGESIDYEYEQTALAKSRMIKTALGMGSEMRWIADGDPLYQVHASVAMKFNLKHKVVDLIRENNINE